MMVKLHTHGRGDMLMKHFIRKSLLILCMAFTILFLVKPYITARAAEIVVPLDIKMYTTSGTPVYAEPDVTKPVALYLERFVNVTVTGITDNGFYQINLNGNYYVPGIYLITQVNPGKTDKQKALDDLKDFSEAYKNQLEQMASYSSSFALIDVTGDGIPEIFDLDGKEIYTYYDKHVVMLYYSDYPTNFYYDKNTNTLIGKYIWNKKEIWEVYYRDMSLVPWGQFKCYSTDASAYKGNAKAISKSYKNDESTRNDMYNILKKMLSL